MKKILLPTDLSELGNYAYDVASKIAKSTDSEIITLYILPGPPGAFYSAEGKLLNHDGDDYSEWYRRLEEKKSSMNEWIKNKSDISDSICTIGEVDKTILAFSEDSDIDLVVMGTEGLFNKSIWSKSSHTEYVTNHTHVPVLSLKCDRSNLDLSNIVFVGDFLENKVLDLKILKKIQDVFGSKIQLLTIKTPKGKRAKEEIIENMTSFAQINKLENYEFNVYEDANIEAGIGKFCAEREIDLIVLGTHQSTGFSSLFKHSVSNDLVNHLFHPILTFPIES